MTATHLKSAALTWIYALALLASGCSWVRFGDLDPPPGRQIVKTVEIEGTDQISASDILSGLETQAESLDPASEKPLLNDAVLPIDARRIEAIYARYGYFSARVRDFRVQTLDDPGLVKVVFSVEEGPPTRLTRIRHIGLDDADLLPSVLKDRTAMQRILDLREELDDLTDIEEGEIWTEERHLAAKAAITNALRREGFLYATVLAEVQVQRERGEAMVLYMILPGPMVRAESFQILGNRLVPESRLSERLLTVIEPGDILTQDLLEELEREIYRLGAFSSVKATPKIQTVAEVSGDKRPSYEALRGYPFEARVPVRVRVGEMNREELLLSFGGSQDSERTEFFVQAAYVHRHLFGPTNSLQFRLKPALVLLPAVPDTNTAGFGGEAEAKLKFPSVIEELLALEITPSYDYVTEDGYRYHVIKGSLGLSRPFGRLTPRVGYSVEYVDFLAIATTLTPDVFERFDVSFSDNYILAQLSLQLVLDLRDDPLDTHKGLLLIGTTSFSVEALGSDFPFTKLSGDARGYIPLAERWTLALRTKMGTTLSASDLLPLSARFKSGGASSMRGFAAGTLGPSVCGVTLDAAETCAVDDQVFIGGNVSFEASVELRWRAPGMWGGVLFYDVGQVWATSDAVDLSKLEHAVGFGIRLRPGFGLFRLDLAWLASDVGFLPNQAHLSFGQSF